MTTALPAERAVGVAATEPRAKPPTAPTAAPIKNFADPSPNETPPHIVSNAHENYTGFQFSIARIRVRRSPSEPLSGMYTCRDMLDVAKRELLIAGCAGSTPRDSQHASFLSISASQPEPLSDAFAGSDRRPLVRAADQSS